jgi:signal transduction histidine kinase
VIDYILKRLGSKNKALRVLVMDQTKEDKRSSRLFLQPLALALVCIFLITLLLMMKLVDLKTLDRTLVDSIENRGLEVIRSVQQVTDLYYERFFEARQVDFDIGGSLAEESISLPESLIRKLIESAQEMDYQLETASSGEEALKKITAREGLWLVALWDGQGVLKSSNRSIPETLLNLADPVVHGQEEIKIHILTPLGSQQELGFIAMRRKFGRGVIVLALDDDAFQFWRVKVSLQRAIDDVGQLPETGYFLVMDQDRRIIGRAGDTSEMETDLVSMDDILKVGEGRRSNKIEFGDKKLLDMFAPIRLRSGFRGFVRLGLTRESADQVLKKNRRDIFISMAFMVVIAVLSMWFLYMNQNRHLAKMGEMETRVHQAERLSALGRLAAGVAHEIRNPLNAISMASQRLQQDNLHQLTGVIRDEIRRLNQIIEEFLTLSRSRKLKFKQRNVTDLLHQIVLLMGEDAGSRGVSLHMDGQDIPFYVSMDSDKLKQALLNIIKNGIESIPGDGSIHISLSPMRKEWISIRISDTGTGLNSTEIKHIFDPDYTTKEKGLGLGLPLAHEIIRGHGGVIQVHSQPGKGTTFEVTLPLHRS